MLNQSFVQDGQREWTAPKKADAGGYLWTYLQPRYTEYLFLGANLAPIVVRAEHYQTWQDGLYL